MYIYKATSTPIRYRNSLRWVLQTKTRWFEWLKNMFNMYVKENVMSFRNEENGL